MAYQGQRPPPQSEWNFEFGSGLPPGALQPSIPGNQGSQRAGPPPPPPPRPQQSEYQQQYQYAPPPPQRAPPAPDVYGGIDDRSLAHAGLPDYGHIAPPRNPRDSVTRRALPKPPLPTPAPSGGGGTSPAVRRALPKLPTPGPPAPQQRISNSSSFSTPASHSLPASHGPSTDTRLPRPPYPETSASQQQYAPPPPPKSVQQQQQQQQHPEAPIRRTTNSSVTTAATDSYFAQTPSLTPNTSMSSGRSTFNDKSQTNDAPAYADSPMSMPHVYEHERQRTTSSSYELQPETPRALPVRSVDQQSLLSENSGSFFALGSTVSTASGTDAHARSSDNDLGGPSQQERHGSTLSIPNSTNSPRHELSPSWAQQAQPPSRWVETKLSMHQAQEDYFDEEGYDEYAEPINDEEHDEEVDLSFFNPALLSEMHSQLRDKVPKGTHVKNGTEWTKTFTGNELVTTIQSLLPEFTRESYGDRRFALITARSIHNQLGVVEVEWDDKLLRDSSDVVFKIMDAMDGTAAITPTGVLTMATKCYSPGCRGGEGCYAPRCPYRTDPGSFLTVALPNEGSSSSANAPVPQGETDWTKGVDPALLAALSDDQRTRQALIRQAILAEERYEADLAALEQVFITPLLTAKPAVIQPWDRLERFTRELFGNVLDIRRSSRLLIDNFGIRAREQSPLICTVGDIFLEAATDCRKLYPQYSDNLPNAEQLLTETLVENRAFALWVDRVSRDSTQRWDIRYLLKRPAMHLQHYPAMIEAILKVTAPDDPDYDFLQESLSSIQNISNVSQLKLFQASKGRGPAAKLEWFDIVPTAVKDAMHKNEFKRQMNIWELIKGEMEFVADLEAIDEVFITPLREAERPIIERARVEVFVDHAFHNYRSLLDVHSTFLAELQRRQLEQHPHFGRVSDLVLDAVLNWHEAYLEYMPHYPIAKAKVDEEKARNPAFASFLNDALRNPLANKQEINHFVYRPIARLLRYPLLLKDILQNQEKVGPPDHEDIETIPQVIELIDNLAKAGQKGVAVNLAKVEVWHMKNTLDGGKFTNRAVKDLDLLNPMRELIHKGKVYRQPEGTITSAWSELHLLLFDNYFVLVKQTKNKNKDAPSRYTINRRPIPLELLSIGEFEEPAQNRSLGLLRNIRNKDNAHEQELQTTSDARTVFPFVYSFIGQGELSGQYTLWTDSSSARDEWKEKLTHAKVLRAEVNEAGKVFEMTKLSVDTFYMAPGYGAHPSIGQDQYTGRVTCSVPFVTSDRRSLVAVGCEQGVWIGVRHDPASLRKVLHVSSVTQVAVLEEFGIFLVLADKSLLAYHLEALVPTAMSPHVRSAPQRLSGVRDIVFFAVGQISGRTLVLYMKRKGMDSVFRVLEPVVNRGQDNNTRRGLGGFLGQRSEWFRVYKDFFIPTEALHVHFLKAKLAIVCAKGFEIMDLTDLKGGSIPIFDTNKQRDRPSLQELARRCESAKPLAMFRSTESEFLLCYESFGIYVDRHGEPNRDHQVIEWEGRPDSVAFHPPYLLLISPSFVEVRHIDSAKLLQIYTGVDIRCTWDGTGGMARPPQEQPGPKGWGDEVMSLDPRIHICKRTDDSRRTKGVEQQIFELQPTQLLNNPLLNPSNRDPNYFPPAPDDVRNSISSNPTATYYPTAVPPTFFTPDLQSQSSASTTTYGNGVSSPGYPGYSPSLPMGVNRRTSGHSSTSGFAGAGGFSSSTQLGNHAASPAYSPDVQSIPQRQQSNASGYSNGAAYGQPAAGYSNGGYLATGQESQYPSSPGYSQQGGSPAPPSPTPGYSSSSAYTQQFVQQQQQQYAQQQQQQQGYAHAPQGYGQQGGQQGYGGGYAQPTGGYPSQSQGYDRRY